MTNPFNVFPKVGYKNSQFQIVSAVDNLRIDFLIGGELLKSEVVNSQFPLVFNSFNATGKIIAKCNFDGKEFSQEIEIRDALRLGSSEFKRAFLFDDSEFSFFLMKDRLLLYDEKKKILLTENHYSPTEILQINKTEFLFITRIGNSYDGVVNLGIYSTQSFDIVGELLNKYREITITPESNSALLFNFIENEIHYFKLSNTEGQYFTQLKVIEGFQTYLLSEDKSNLIIQYPNHLIFADLLNIHSQISVEFKSNNAIDKYGNIFTLLDDKLFCSNPLMSYSQQIKLPFKINLISDHFIHIGDEFNFENQIIDFEVLVVNQYNQLISTIPNDKSEYIHNIKLDDRTTDLSIQHDLYCTSKGVYVIEKKTIRSLIGIKFNLDKGIWLKKPMEKKEIEFSIKYLDSQIDVDLTDKYPHLTIKSYQFPMLLVRIGENQVLLSGTRSIKMSSENVFTLFKIEDIPYFSVQVEDQFSLYKANDLQQTLLNKIKILNSRFYIEHKIIWYSGNPRINNEAIQLKAFDLTKSSKIPVNDYKIYSSSYDYLLKYQFHEGYAISNDQILFNPRNFDVKSSIVGKLEEYSMKLDKIVSHRDNNLLLSTFNNKTLKYDLAEISINSEKFKESYMSPDGRFLVLQQMNNTYYYYDIERNERLNFVSGNFLDFRKDGNLIVEDNKRAIKIIDPITFQEVPSTNYHHYRFLSPDGKLYSQLSIKTRYYHKLNECEITKREFDILKFFIDIPKNLLNNIDLEKAKSRVERNRKELFEKFKTKCLALNIKSPHQINSEKLVLVERFIEIGITGTNIVTEVPVPVDLEYYNHAAFSFDNKYFSYVGKPTFNGLIHLYQLDFDESKSLLKIKKSYLTRLPRRASWVCGFSKTGYFATYDSIPDTYIIFVDDSLFESKLYEFDLRNKMKQNKSNFYHTYKNWNIMENKNFLSFSSSGRYLALSEQGYDPLTLNGHGHQESNIVHIAKTENGEVLNSFTGHGDKISYNRGKNVVFVSFSEDEKRIMTLSNDGVVFIRNIEIGDD